MLRTLAPVFIALACSPPCLSHAKEFPEPVVARAQMNLQVGEKVIDTIEKGDLLTRVGGR